MLVDWIHWVQSLRPVELFSLLSVLLLVDGTRYALASTGLVLCDLCKQAWQLALGTPNRPVEYDYCPTVCVVIAGHNEAETIEATLDSLWNTYPLLDIVVVDDGSTDGMADVACDYARHHQGIRILSRPQRGGKSSGLNWGLSQAQAEVIITLDADSRLGPNALWEIVQPLRNPKVGAVSGTITVWNASRNLVTWLQAFEYRHSIFLGRRLQSRLGMLGIVSGAFGAFRRDLLEQLMGWDAGSGEDGDLALRIRKSGYEIEFAPEADCLTNAPESWAVLFRQRLRWDRAVVTFECRKHIDMGKFWQSHFRPRNFLLILERWLFNVVFVFGYWFGLIWLYAMHQGPFWRLLLLLYSCQLCLEVLTTSALLFYSDRRWRDLVLALAIPFVPLYQAFIKLVDLVAVTDELILRKSYQDNYVPRHVREATWKW